MPYVERDTELTVIGKFARLQPGIAEEWLDEGHPDLQTPLADYKSAAKSNIDRKAGEIREAYTSKGFGITDEYRLAEEQAKAYLADTTQPVPSCVVSAADYEGLDYPAAAQSIIDEAAIMTTALENIRTARLSGKKSIDAAIDLTAVESAEAAANAELDSLRP